MASDTEWLEDYLSEVLSSHAFVNPLADFVDENSSLFDDDSPEGNYLTHTDCHKKFLELMECQLETALASVGLTPEDFAALCQASPPSSRLRQIVDRLMYVDDFMFFKKLMAKRNAELNMEALREMNRAAEAAALAAAAAEAGGRGGGRGGADDEEEASIRLALELSQAGEASSGATMVTGPDDEDPELAVRATRERGGEGGGGQLCFACRPNSFTTDISLGLLLFSSFPPSPAGCSPCVSR